MSMFDDEDEDGLQDWLDKYDINEKFVSLFTNFLRAHPRQSRFGHGIKYSTERTMCRFVISNC